MKWLSDETLAHLQKVIDWPDLEGSRYELLEKIGQGGMGAVFLVRDRDLDRQVALKVLHATHGASQASARMMKEARILARLEHPSILPVHDCGVLPDGRFYYAMKLVRGQRLDERMLPATPLTERLQLFLRICDAVAFAHAHGVIHRDLKPQNIMLGAFGEILIIDWGVAKEIGHQAGTVLSGEGEAPAEPFSSARQEPHPPELAFHHGSGQPASEPVDGPLELSPQTTQGTVVGTPGYMAPEQVRGEVDNIDERTDVYALGAILHFLLTGRAPIYESPVGTSGLSAATSPVSPRQHDRSIPRPLEAVCMRALAAERCDRHVSAAELGGDVADFIAGRRVRSYPEGPLEAAWRLGTKYRTAVILVLTYLVVRILLFLVNP